MIPRQRFLGDSCVVRSVLVRRGPDSPTLVVLVMKLSQLAGVVWLLAALTVPLGCSDSDPGKSQAGKKKASASLPIRPSEIGKVDTDRTLGPLDEGRIMVSPPEDWEIASRAAEKRLARFKKFEQFKYPTILITAADYEDTFDVTRQNVAQFAKQIAAKLNTDMLSKAVEPIEIGSLVGVTYQQPARVTGGGPAIILDRVFVETVVSGRKYKLELHTYEGKAKDSEPQLYAVAGGMEFLEKPKAPEEEPVEEPEEEPAEKPEADTEEKPPPQPEDVPEAKPEQPDPDAKTE